MNEKKPKRCIDAVFKCCYRCPYGVVINPSCVETFDDFSDCCYDTSCMFGFENDKLTPKELKEFNKFIKNMR